MSPREDETPSGVGGYSQNGGNSMYTITLNGEEKAKARGMQAAIYKASELQGENPAVIIAVVTPAGKIVASFIPGEPEEGDMNKCTYCGRTSNCKTKFIGGYEILECCTDCEAEIQEGKWHVLQVVGPDGKDYIGIDQDPCGEVISSHDTEDQAEAAAREYALKTGVPEFSEYRQESPGGMVSEYVCPVCGEVYQSNFPFKVCYCLNDGTEIKGKPISK